MKPWIHPAPKLVYFGWVSLPFCNYSLRFLIIGILHQYSFPLYLYMLTDAYCQPLPGVL